MFLWLFRKVPRNEAGSKANTFSARTGDAKVLHKVPRKRKKHFCPNVSLFPCAGNILLRKHLLLPRNQQIFLQQCFPISGKLKIAIYRKLPRNHVEISLMNTRTHETKLRATFTFHCAYAPAKHFRSRMMAAVIFLALDVALCVLSWS